VVVVRRMVTSDNSCSTNGAGYVDVGRPVRQLSQAKIVENKNLGAVLSHIPQR
jgi:hypothetical protein